MQEKIPYKYVALYLNKIYNVDNARVVSYTPVGEEEEDDEDG